MKIITWNVRDINAPNKRIRIKKVLDETRGDIILLKETNLSDEKYEESIAKWKNWKFVHCPSARALGGLTTLWNPKVLTSSLIEQELGWQCFKFQHF